MTNREIDRFCYLIAQHGDMIEIHLHPDATVLSLSEFFRCLDADTGLFDGGHIEVWKSAAGYDAGIDLAPREIDEYPANRLDAIDVIRQTLEVIEYRG